MTSLRKLNEAANAVSQRKFEIFRKMTLTFRTNFGKCGVLISSLSQQTVRWVSTEEVGKFTGLGGRRDVQTSLRKIYFAGKMSKGNVCVIEDQSPPSYGGDKRKFLHRTLFVFISEWV
ncbi:hypothetical protein AVEN_237546-1 [Araneus ventricosus]|uniref:Uncharacterized protein n=1 Tax=Araneus ventricosus TaxID=182803 RepID=A0A4Y2MVX4_ARAVE|nr:hypothetical protein AVEN_237546-1 [Araneus ventricosus]